MSMEHGMQDFESQEGSGYVINTKTFAFACMCTTFLPLGFPLWCPPKSGGSGGGGGGPDPQQSLIQ